MKKNLFNSKMALFEDTPETLAEYLEITKQTVRDKRDGKSQFKQSEITKIATRWHLTPEETVDMFLGEGE